VTRTAPGLLLPALFFLLLQSGPPAGNAREDRGDIMANFNPQNTSLIVIDVQKYFIPGFPGAISPAIPGQDEVGKLANVLSLIEAAKKLGLNMFVTYEAGKRGLDAMPDELHRELPEKNCREFIKQYFDLTRQPKLSRALEKSGTRNVVLCGAETDVCVLQSATGLLKKGYRVYLAEDAVFTSTTLNEPALKRMQMAGVRIVKTAEAIRAIENSGIPVGAAGFEKRTPLPDIEAGRVAAVIINYDDKSLERAADPKKEQKKIRIGQLNHYAEVLEIPVYYLHAGRVDGLKKAMHLPPQVHFLEAAVSYPEPIKKLAVVLRGAKVSQVALGGIEENTIVEGAVSLLVESGLQVHVMEDVVLEDGGTAEEGAFDNLYRAGAVPCSFKMFIYDATEGIQAVIKKRWREMFRAKLAKKEILWVDELPFVRDSQ